MCREIWEVAWKYGKWLEKYGKWQGNMASYGVQFTVKYGKWQGHMGSGRKLWDVAGEYGKWQRNKGSGREGSTKIYGK